MPSLKIRAFIESDKPDTAQKVARRFAKDHGFVLNKVEPYHKGGHQAHLQRSLSGTWEQIAFHSIEIAQGCGTGLSLGGWIKDNLDMSIQRPSSVGVTDIFFHIERDGSEDST